MEEEEEVEEREARRKIWGPKETFLMWKLSMKPSPNPKPIRNEYSTRVWKNL